ncbi:hypothetical protein F5B18DRAFT_657383 [Nemania serpens]|nr:hypothetical protein F5B18DRAFT_657383 [Nemania serpens]
MKRAHASRPTSDNADLQERPAVVAREDSTNLHTNEEEHDQHRAKRPKQDIEVIELSDDDNNNNQASNQEPEPVDSVSDSHSRSDAKRTNDICIPVCHLCKSAAEKAAESSEELCTAIGYRREKLGKYELSTEDSIRKNLRAQEEQRRADLVKSKTTPEESTVATDDDTITSRESTTATEETTTSDTTHERDRDTKTPDWERMYANILPEHMERQDGEIEAARQQDAQMKEVEAKKTQEEDEQKCKGQERLLRDPPLFPNGWFKNSKHHYDEIEVRHLIEDAETFFALKTDRDGRHWFSVLGPSSVPKPDPYKNMPAIIERNGGVEVVYVIPSFHTAKIERGKGNRKRTGENGE